MSVANVTESEIQGLKAQEAKDLCIDLLRKLKEKGKAPISAGEVQLRELQYELKLKEAEAEDGRQREAHALRLKELELQIEQEKARQAEAQGRTEQVRQEHAQLFEQVQASQEALSVQLERASREHNVRIEQLEAEFTSKAEELRGQRDQLQSEKERLEEEIATLAELQETADTIARLREQLESRRAAGQRQLEQLDEEIESSEFTKTKRVNELRRQQELEISELQAKHKKMIIEMNRKAADELLAGLGMVAVEKAAWEASQQSTATAAARDEAAVAEIRAKAREDFRREYNITAPEVIDVTELFYAHKAVTAEAEALRRQVDKQEAEIKRMREHIEREPQRIATAVEAAKVQIQNNIEQASPR